LQTLPAAAAAASASDPGGAPGVIRLSEDQRIAIGLRFARVQPGTQAWISLPGTVVVPGHRLDTVALPIGGRITDLTVAVGDRVRAGQTVLRLESAQAIELQRSLSAAQSQLALARDTWERDRQLHAEGLIAESRLRAAQWRLQEAQALLAERRAQLQLSGLTPVAGAAASARDTPDAWRSSLAISAPVAGVVTEVLVTRGQRIDAAAPAVRIAQEGERWLELQASGSRATSIALGDRVTWAERGVIGKVSAIASMVGPGQTLTIRALIEQGAERLRAGEVMQARVELAASRRPLWRVPAAALARLGTDTVVFVAQAQGLRAQAVKIQGQDDAGVLIEAPVTGADQVAISGLSALKAMAMEQRP